MTIGSAAAIRPPLAAATLLVAKDRQSGFLAYRDVSKGRKYGLDEER